MTQDGEIKGDEYWLICPFCHDSGKSSVKFSVNRTTRAYHCFRCGAGGKATFDEFLKWTGQLPGLFSTGAQGPKSYTDLELFPGSATGRRSLLDCRRTAHDVSAPGGGLLDVFRCRKPDGELVGLHYRGRDYARTYGTRGLGFVGQFLGDHSLRAVGEGPPETGGSWIRLVEGPYDVVEDRDVCTFGLPSIQQLRLLRGYEVVLCPDGDVWSRPDLLRTLLYHIRRVPGFVLRDIEFLEEGLDPDEVPPTERRRIGEQGVRDLLRSVNEYEANRRGGGARWVWKEHSVQPPSLPDWTPSRRSLSPAASTW